MKILKVLYGIALLIGALLLVYYRRSSLLGASPTAVDLAFLGLAVALLLLPLVAEISVGGVTLKRQLEATRSELSARIEQVRNEVSNSVAVSSVINLNAPVTSEEIAGARERANELHLQGSSKPEQILLVDENTSVLFAARYNLEKELRRLALLKGVQENGWQASAFQLSKKLADFEVFDRSLLATIHDVYRICSPAIHGDATTPDQVDLVRSLAPKLVATLRSIE